MKRGIIIRRRVQIQKRNTCHQNSKTFPINLTRSFSVNSTNGASKGGLEIPHHAGFSHQSRNCLKFMFTPSLPNHAENQVDLSRNNAIFYPIPVFTLWNMTNNAITIPPWGVRAFDCSFNCNWFYIFCGSVLRRKKLNLKILKNRESWNLYIIDDFITMKSDTHIFYKNGECFHRGSTSLKHS